MKHEVERYEGELRELREQVRLLCHDTWQDYILVNADGSYVTYSSSLKPKELLKQAGRNAQQLYVRIL
ncbi:MAG: hypothetical protein EBW51_07580 [Actinobacteria bacterium]|nr:hypothetical protein [Actinomycetota bacterium]